MAGQGILRNLNALKGKPPVGAAGGTFNPLAAIGSFLGGVPGSILGLTQLEGSTPQGGPTDPRLLQGRAMHAGQTGMYGRYGQPDPSLQYAGQPSPAPAARPPAPTPSFGGSPLAAERAYQSEKSRVAQLAAQDPELQRYERARQLAAAPGATPQQVQSAEDIGMQMWAKANPTLAAKVRPGQAGYDTIQGALAGGAARAGYGYQMPQQITQTPPIGPGAPQGLPAVQSFGPGATYNPQELEAKGLQLDAETIKKFKDLLNLAKP